MLIFNASGERQNFIFRMSNYFIFFLYILTFPTPVYLCKTAVSSSYLNNCGPNYLILWDIKYLSKHYCQM